MLIISSIWDAQIWYSVPLILVISLVYGATRHEYLKEIFIHALRAGIWLVGFLGIIFLVVWWVSQYV